MLNQPKALTAEEAAAAAIPACCQQAPMPNPWKRPLCAEQTISTKFDLKVSPANGLCDSTYDISIKVKHRVSICPLWSTPSLSGAPLLLMFVMIKITASPWWWWGVLHRYRRQAQRFLFLKVRESFRWLIKKKREKNTHYFSINRTLMQWKFCILF